MPQSVRTDAGDSITKRPLPPVAEGMTSKRPDPVWNKPQKIQTYVRGNGDVKQHQRVRHVRIATSRSK